jgi:hypothetical protein
MTLALHGPKPRKSRNENASLPFVHLAAGIVGSRCDGSLRRAGVVDKLPALSEFNGDPRMPSRTPPGARAARRWRTSRARSRKPLARPRPELQTLILSDLELTDEADVATILRTLAKAAA